MGEGNNLKVMNYIEGGKYPEVEFGKYVYSVREGQSREGRQYIREKLSLVHDMTWDDWYTILRGY